MGLRFSKKLPGSPRTLFNYEFFVSNNLLIIKYAKCYLINAIEHLFEIQHRLEEIIGVPKIDLIQKGAIHPALRERILSEAVNVAYVVEIPN
jgi:hypothetical protein